MRRRTRTTVALSVSLTAAVCVSLTAGPAAARPALVDPEPVPLHEVVADALAAAAVDASAPRALADETSVPDWGPVLDGVLDDVAAGSVVGVTARVETPDVRWRGAAGLREHGRAAPAGWQDRFRAASITKPMVATLVMQEVEAGTWDLDTTVAEVLPGVLPGHAPHLITVEHLLAHRSGLGNHLGDLLVSRLTDPTDPGEQFAVLGQEYPVGDHVAAMSSVPLAFPPGAGFEYSNAGYVVLGMMLQEATGQSVATLMRDRVFRPAGMRHSAYPEKPGTKGPFLVGAADLGPYGDGVYSLGHFHPTFFDAAGAVTTTTADLQAFWAALLGGDLVAPETVADMLDPRTVDMISFGLGVTLWEDPCVPGEHLVGHDGAAMGGFALALTSTDAQRHLSFGLTGRDYVTGDMTGFFSVANALAAASC